jgi:hypothetical protein
VPVLVDPIRAERQPQPYGIFYNDFEEIRVPQQQRAQAMLQIAPPDAPPLLQIEPEGVAVPVEAEPVIPRPRAAGLASHGGGFRGLFPRIPDYLRVGGFRRGDLPNAGVFNLAPRPDIVRQPQLQIEPMPEEEKEPERARPQQIDPRRAEELAARERALAEGRRINQQFQEFDAFFVAPPAVERQQPEQAIPALPAPYEWQTDRLKEQYDAARTVAAQNDVVQLNRQVRDQRANARRYEQDLTSAGIQNEQKAQIERENQLIQRRMERMESDRKRDEENILAAVQFRQKIQDDNSIDDIFAPMEAKQAAAAQRSADFLKAKEDEEFLESFEYGLMPYQQDELLAAQKAQPRSAVAWGLETGDPNLKYRKSAAEIMQMQPDERRDFFKRRKMFEKEARIYKEAKLARGEDAKLEEKFARDQEAGFGAGAPRERGLEPTEQERQRKRQRGLQPQLPMSIFAYNLPPNVTGRTKERKAASVPTVMGVAEQPARKRMVSADPSAEREENLFAQQQLVQRNPDDLQKANAPLEGFGNLDLSSISGDLYDFDGSGGSRAIASTQSLEDTISEIENQ